MVDEGAAGHGLQAIVAFLQRQGFHNAEQALLAEVRDRWGGGQLQLAGRRSSKDDVATTSSGYDTAAASPSEPVALSSETGPSSQNVSSIVSHSSSSPANAADDVAGRRPVLKVVRGASSQSPARSAAKLTDWSMARRATDSSVSNKGSSPAVQSAPGRLSGRRAFSYCDFAETGYVRRPIDDMAAFEATELEHASPSTSARGQRAARKHPPADYFHGWVLDADAVRAGEASGVGFASGGAPAPTALPAGVFASLTVVPGGRAFRSSASEKAASPMGAPSIPRAYASAHPSFPQSAPQSPARWSLARDGLALSRADPLFIRLPGAPAASSPAASGGSQPRVASQSAVAGGSGGGSGGGGGGVGGGGGGDEEEAFRTFHALVDGLAQHPAADAFDVLDGSSSCTSSHWHTLTDAIARGDTRQGSPVGSPSPSTRRSLEGRAWPPGSSPTAYGQPSHSAPGQPFVWPGDPDGLGGSFGGSFGGSHAHSAPSASAHADAAPRHHPHPTAFSAPHLHIDVPGGAGQPSSFWDGPHGFMAAGSRPAFRSLAHASASASMPASAALRADARGASDRPTHFPLAPHATSRSVPGSPGALSPAARGDGSPFAAVLTHAPPRCTPVHAHRPGHKRSNSDARQGGNFWADWSPASSGMGPAATPLSMAQSEYTSDPEYESGLSTTLPDASDDHASLMGHLSHTLWAQFTREVARDTSPLLTPRSSLVSDTSLRHSTAFVRASDAPTPADPPSPPPAADDRQLPRVPSHPVISDGSVGDLELSPEAAAAASALQPYKSVSLRRRDTAPPPAAVQLPPGLLAVADRSGSLHDTLPVDVAARVDSDPSPDVLSPGSQSHEVQSTYSFAMHLPSGSAADAAADAPGHEALEFRSATSAHSRGTSFERAHFDDGGDDDARCTARTSRDSRDTRWTRDTIDARDARDAESLSSAAGPRVESLNERDLLGFDALGAAALLDRSRSAARPARWKPESPRVRSAPPVAVDAGGERPVEVDLQQALQGRASPAADPARPFLFQPPLLAPPSPGAPPPSVSDAEIPTPRDHSSEAGPSGPSSTAAELGNLSDSFLTMDSHSDFQPCSDSLHAFLEAQHVKHVATAVAASGAANVLQPPHRERDAMQSPVCSHSTQANSVQSLDSYFPDDASVMSAAGRAHSPRVTPRSPDALRGLPLWHQASSEGDGLPHGPKGKHHRSASAASLPTPFSGGAFEPSAPRERSGLSFTRTAFPRADDPWGAQPSSLPKLFHRASGPAATSPASLSMHTLQPPPPIAAPVQPSLSWCPPWAQSSLNANNSTSTIDAIHQKASASSTLVAAFGSLNHPPEASSTNNTLSTTATQPEDAPCPLHADPGPPPSLALTLQPRTEGSRGGEDDDARECVETSSLAHLVLRPEKPRAAPPVRFGSMDALPQSPLVAAQLDAPPPPPRRQRSGSFASHRTSATSTSSSSGSDAPSLPMLTLSPTQLAGGGRGGRGAAAASADADASTTFGSFGRHATLLAAQRAEDGASLSWGASSTVTTAVSAPQSSSAHDDSVTLTINALPAASIATRDSGSRRMGRDLSSDGGTSQSLATNSLGVSGEDASAASGAPLLAKSDSWRALASLNGGLADGSPGDSSPSPQLRTSDGGDAPTYMRANSVFATPAPAEPQPSAAYAGGESDDNSSAFAEGSGALVRSPPSVFDDHIPSTASFTKLSGFLPLDDDPVEPPADAAAAPPAAAATARAVSAPKAVPDAAAAARLSRVLPRIKRPRSEPSRLGGAEEEGDQLGAGDVRRDAAPPPRAAAAAPHLDSSSRSEVTEGEMMFAPSSAVHSTQLGSPTRTDADSKQDSKQDMLSWRRFSNTWSESLVDDVHAVPASPLSEGLPSGAVSSRSSLHREPFVDCDFAGGPAQPPAPHATAPCPGGAAAGLTALWASSGQQSTSPQVSPASYRSSQQRSSAVSSLQGYEEELEIIQLRVYHRKHRTGFESSTEIRVAPGDVIINRYCVSRCLGSAAFSSAFAAHDLQAGRDVCLKIIKSSKDFFDQSLDEIKLLRYINAADPDDACGILRLYDFFYYKEHLVLVTELLRVNLYEWQKRLQDGSLPPFFTMGRIQSIARQVLRSLKFMHGLNLVHCDLKPENIMIQSFSDCAVKVIDLGSSSFTWDQPATYIQSRCYRAPEVVIHAPYCAKIDIWSLGCILAELAAGSVLFQNTSAATLLARVEAVCGPLPMTMLLKGANTAHFYTRSRQLYERVDGAAHVLQPKRIALRDLMPGADALFVAFLQTLLVPCPDGRATAEEALRHPWLQQKYDDSHYEAAPSADHLLGSSPASSIHVSC